MAILTRKTKDETPTISYAGMVVGKVVRDERIMSDVWAYSTYAIVYDIIQDQTKEIFVHCDFDGGYSTVEVDASPELMLKYAMHLVRKERHKKAVHLVHEHNARWLQAHHMGVTLGQYKRLKRLGADSYDILYTLLGTKKFRNEFRAKLAEQVRNWLNDPEPKYRTPLSPKQMACADTRHFGRRFFY
jgi:hypothetical protein